MEKFFVYKCKWSLSLALPYLVDLFINMLKTKFNNLFYRTILNTKRIHNSFWRNVPARAKQTPSKVLFVAKKKRRPRPYGKYPLLATSTSVINSYLGIYLKAKQKKHSKQISKQNKTKRKKKGKKGKGRFLADFEPRIFGLTRPHIATTPLRMIAWRGE